MTVDATGPAAPPRRNGELVFAAPWERRLFGVTMALVERGVFAWDDFRVRLIEAIGEWERTAQAGAVYRYYAHWERALVRVLEARGVVAGGELATRAAAIEHARAHEHDHDHDH